MLLSNIQDQHENYVPKVHLILANLSILKNIFREKYDLVIFKAHGVTLDVFCAGPGVGLNDPDGCFLT